MLPAFQLSPLTAANSDPSHEDIISTACTFAMWQQASGNGQAAMLTCDKLQLYFMQRQNIPPPQKGGGSSSVVSNAGAAVPIPSSTLAQQHTESRPVTTRRDDQSFSSGSHSGSVTAAAAAPTLHHHPTSPVAENLQRLEATLEESVARSQRVRTALQSGQPREETREDVVASLANIFGLAPDVVTTAPRVAPRLGAESDNAAKMLSPKHEDDRRAKRPRSPGSDHATSTPSSSSTSLPSSSSSPLLPRSPLLTPSNNGASAAAEGSPQQSLKSQSQQQQQQQCGDGASDVNDPSEVLSPQAAQVAAPTLQQAEEDPKCNSEGRGKRSRSPLPPADRSESGEASCKQSRVEAVHASTAHSREAASRTQLPALQSEAARIAHSEEDDVEEDRAPIQKLSSFGASDDFDASFVISARSPPPSKASPAPRSPPPPPLPSTSASGATALPRRAGPPTLNTQRRALRAHKAGILSSDTASWSAASLPQPIPPASVALHGRSRSPPPTSAAPTGQLGPGAPALDATFTDVTPDVSLAKAGGLPKRKTYQKPA